MRHRKSFNHLKRESAHRKAMLSNMASSLIIHKRISTTVAKAKALKMYVEPLITKAKNDTTHSRRVVFSYLQNKDAVKELFRDVAEKVADRPGGYTRIIKTGARLGDNAEMCLIELVDFNDNLLAAKAEQKEKSTRKRRRRGSGKSQTEKPQQVEAKAEEVVEDVEVVEPKAEDVKAEVEVKEEPAAEVKEEPAKEEKKEEPAAEVKEEPVKEEEPEKKEDKKEE